MLLSSCITQSLGIYHTAGENEKISEISKLYNIDESLLREENQIPKESTFLEEGATIFIPEVREKLEYRHKETEEVKVKKEPLTHFILPSQGEIITPFGGEFENKNEGIDIKLPEGSEVIASADGKVLFSASHEGFGNTVIIQHCEKFITIYAHLKEITVKEGQLVKQGDLVGFSGKTGAISTPCLHFEIRENSKPVDPEIYLNHDFHKIK